jgi:hypothetical protein
LTSKKIVVLLALLIGLCAFGMVGTAMSSGQIATCNTCGSTDNYGAKKDTFSPSEDVYVTGTGFPSCKTFNIYVVSHKDNWNDGDPIPSRIAGTATTVSSDNSGNILPTIVWPHNLTPGKYDIIIDVNGNCVYDKNVDCLDANDCQVNAGFFVIPEYLLSILGVAGFFAAYGVFRFSKRKRVLP